MSECNPGVAIAPRTIGIGSTMVQTIRHSANRIQIGGSGSSWHLKNSGDSTHDLASDARTRRWNVR